MASSFMDRLKMSVNVLRDKPSGVEVDSESSITSVYPASVSTRVSYDGSKTVLAPIMNRISIDVAAIPFNHVKLDHFGQFKGIVQSELNDRLSIRANIDQSGTAFIQDAAQTLLEYGSCALVPIEIDRNPQSGGFDILSIRVGLITQWYNRSVGVSVYNELTGQREERQLPKGFVGIAYNPMYSVMNETNSTLRRLIDRLAMLDMADGKLFSPQLDLIIQLPFALKNQRRQDEAERRLEVIEGQLNDSKRGIAYIDQTEKVTQLNRPITNTLFDTVVKLNDSLHAQLGLTPSIFAGEATAEEMIHYNNRTILPIAKALSDAMVGSFFTRTAIAQRHRVMGIPNLFKMAPLSEFADSADKFTRNEILSSNELRAQMGLVPSSDPKADELRNKNINKPAEEAPLPAPAPAPAAVEEQPIDNEEQIDE